MIHRNLPYRFLRGQPLNTSVWSNTLTTNIHKLQLVQNFAARIILGLRKYDHISACLSPSYLSHKFSTRAIVHNRQTRYRDSLNIPSCRINSGQRAFWYRGVTIWNNLSKDLREIINAKVFKRRLIDELICNMNLIRC